MSIKERILSYQLDEDTLAMFPGAIFSIALVIYCYI